VAYADSSSDLSMLEAVGFPVAVNPEPRLATIARTRGWLIEEFDTAEGHRPPMLPLAPRRRGAS
jgi:phosphoserine phosphatase